MEAFEGILAFYSGMSMFTSLISIVMYVLSSLGMYTIANRRGINNAWLAWIPVGSVWILGSIADDYRQKARGEVKNRRTLLMVVTIVMVVLTFVAFGSVIAPLVEAAIDGDAMDMEDLVDDLLSMGFAMMLVSVCSIVYTVFYYICLYELFTSCDPNNKALYLVLSILISWTMPVLIFICRNKDDGMYPAPRPAAYGYMPPQYQQPPYGQPVYQQPPYGQPYQPQQPVYQQPVYQQPVYQQPQQPQQPAAQEPGSQQ